ncbi:hypothetical protein CDL15_Pgr019461 [Punica granatum]|uniref:Uncharacterized protein n=1 Tax=Punica granatum TaxID=22663 RepID=A0A218VUD3_PUNGR|nr:hypothetical protein CDL15_Pgr019461 [Punica granatum]
MRMRVSLLDSKMRVQSECRLREELRSEMLNMVREELAQHDKQLKKRENGLERQINKVDQKMNKFFVCYNDVGEQGIEEEDKQRL